MAIRVRYHFKLKICDEFYLNNDSERQSLLCLRIFRV